MQSSASRPCSQALRRISQHEFLPRSLRSYSQYDPSAASTVTAPEVQSARKFCLDNLMKYDTPSFIARTYIPAPARDAFIAIRAFNLEVARTADTTSTPTVGAMRLQFQRDAVSKTLLGSPPKQPVFILLSKAVEDLRRQTDGRSNFSKNWLNRVITTREQYLGNPPYPDLNALESYAENTYSTLMYLTLQALPLASVSADHLASHIGKATGITTVLKGLPLIAFPSEQRHHSNQGGMAGSVGSSRQGAVPLPLDIMAEYGVKEEDVIRNGSDAAGLRDAVFAVATRANDHLITAREMLRNLRAGQDVGHEFEHQDEEEHAHAVPTNSKITPAQEVERAFGVFMPAVHTSLWLDRLEKLDFDVFNPKLRSTDWKLPWRTWWAFTRKSI
ncbi:NADH dehydrogenase (ubiquinone) complex I, assembly factor 6 [Sphaceloma murrayae]|uniref:NADH dehydrogenase (Ubiquinone) complex I, assembly factor 6 n=1 Tax=Sphaceloma murrayae TaxID=2082308 RepID=A0A2K1QVY0_9PEZI|nr:NADH dehydrogenase (ubiquinone) complex I, assembly factor 6 [Sphaceloma murrayae]